MCAKFNPISPVRGFWSNLKRIKRKERKRETVSEQIKFIKLLYIIGANEDRERERQGERRTLAVNTITHFINSTTSHQQIINFS